MDDEIRDEQLDESDDKVEGHAMHKDAHDEGDDDLDRDQTKK